MPSRTLALKARDELFHKGQLGHEVYVVRRGRLRLGAVSPRGQEFVFGIAGPGDLVGELSALSGGRRTATATALEDCELVVLDGGELTALVRGHPDSAFRLLEVLAGRIRALGERLEDQAFLDVKARIAKTLLALRRRFGVPDGSGVRIDLRISQEELGSMVCASRESVNKHLRDWVAGGVVRLEGGYIAIDAPERLSEEIA